MTHIRLIPLALTALCLHAPAALAADTPSNMESPPVQAKADPLQAVRDAIKARQWPQAMSRLQALLPQMPRNADVHNLLGYVYRKQATPDLDKAIDHYQKALAIDPAHKGAHEYIGEAWLTRNQPDKAREHLESLRRICGGTACEEYQDLAQAIAAFGRTASPAR